MEKLTNIEKFQQLQLLYQLKCNYHKREIKTTLDKAQSALLCKSYLKDIINLGVNFYSVYNKITELKK